MDCTKLGYVINISLMYFAFVFVYPYFIQKCENSLLVCVCVQANCHFISGELAYDDDHVGDGEAQSFLGKCSNRCDIGTQGFYFTCYNSMNSVLVL